MTTDLVPHWPLPQRPTPQTIARRRARGRLIVRAVVVATFAVPLALFALSLDDGEAVAKAAALAERGVDTPIVPLNRWGVRFTGILAGVLVFLQLGLMARIPLVERSFDRSRLVTGHAVVGFALMLLVAVHVGVRVYGLIAFPDPVVGEAVDDVSGWHSLVRFFADWPYLLAAAGLVLLLTVVLTSALRRALPRVRWHRIHLLAYLVLAAATPHELLRGTTSSHEGAAAAVATGYWVTVLILSYLAVVYYRIYLPASRSWSYVLTVRSVRVVFEPRDSVYHVELVSLRGADLTGFGVTPGQHVLVYPENNKHHWPTPSSYSVSNTVSPLSAATTPGLDGQQCLRLTIKVGNTDDLPVEGDVVHVAGPYGHFTLESLVNPSGRRRVLFLVSGMGVTPVLPMVEQLLREVDAHPDTHVVVAQRAHSERLRPFSGRLSDLAEDFPGRLRIDELLGASTPGRYRSWLPAPHLAGDEAEVLARLVSDVRERDVFICGPSGWSRRVRKTLRELGVPRAQVHEERFA